MFLHFANAENIGRRGSFPKGKRDELRKDVCESIHLTLDEVESYHIPSHLTFKEKI